MTANMVIGGDPNKVDVAGYTAGDILAADASGELAPVPIGANAEILAVDTTAPSEVEWVASGAGATLANTVVTETSYGQASTAGVSTEVSRGDHTHGTPTAPASLIVRQARITSGNVTLPSTAGAWQAVPGFSLVIPASAGDYVDLGVEFLWDTASADFLDLAVSVNGVLSRFMSSGTATPAVEGLPGLYPNIVDFFAIMSPLGFQVQAGDLFGGNVTWVLAANSTGVAQVFASAAFPFFWRSINYRAVDFA